MFRTLKYTLLLAWLLAVSFAYYRLFPLSGILAGLPQLPSLAAPWRSLGHLFCLLLFLVSANGWGCFFWSRAELSLTERFVFATAGGLGIISLLVLLLNQVPAAGAPWYFAVLLSGGALFLATGARKLTAAPRPRFRLLFLLSLPPALSALIGALAPPTQFDSLVYHLALPARYLASGSMSAGDNFFFAFPQNLEMLFELALRLDGDILANLIGWSFLPLTGLALYAFTRRYWGSRTGILAALLWLCTPAALFLATGTYVDLGLAFFVLAGLYGFLLWSHGASRSWLYWAGAFAGFACGVKYTAALPGAILLALVLFEKRDGNRLRNALAFSAVAFAVFAPWLLKNYLLLHNPVAPWGTALFARSSIAPETAAQYFHHIENHGTAVKGLAGLVSLPWDLTAYGFRFGGGFDIAGPLFLLFVPVLFFGLKIDKISRILLVVAVLFGAGWMASGKVLRFLVPVLPLLCIFSARGFAWLAGHQRLKYVAYPVLMAGLAHNLLLFHWTMASVDPYRPVLGGESRDSYLSRKLSYYPALKNAVNTLPAGSRTLFWGETRTYYCTAERVAPTVFDPHPLAVRANAAASPQALISALKADGITHMLVSPGEVRRLNTESVLSAAGRERWAEVLRSHSREIYRDRQCHLYEITD